MDALLTAGEVAAADVRLTDGEVAVADARLTAGEDAEDEARLAEGELRAAVEVEERRKPGLNGVLRCCCGLSGIRWFCPGLSGTSCWDGLCWYTRGEERLD